MKPEDEEELKQRQLWGLRAKDRRRRSDRLVVTWFIYGAYGLVGLIAIVLGLAYCASRQ